MRLVFAPQGWEDYTYWQRADRSTLKRINRLIDDALRDPSSGIGKPEPPKYGIAGAWSRRITDEHRLVYRVLDDDLVILQARYHYQNNPLGYRLHGSCFRAKEVGSGAGGGICAEVRAGAGACGE